MRKFMFLLITSIPVVSATNYPPAPTSEATSVATSVAKSKSAAMSVNRNDLQNNNAVNNEVTNAASGGSARVSDVNSSSKVGDVSSNVGNVSSVSGPSTSSAATSIGDVGSVSSSSLSANGAGANSNNINLTQNYESYRIPVTTAYAASLTSGQDTCLGSASGGVQTQVVGVSIGKTVVDKNCVLIKQVQLLTQMNLPAAACFRARSGAEGAEIDKAMAAAGVDCSKLVPPPVIVQQPVVNDNKYITREELLERENRILRHQAK